MKLTPGIYEIGCLAITSTFHCMVGLLLELDGELSRLLRWKEGRPAATVSSAVFSSNLLLPSSLSSSSFSCDLLSILVSVCVWYV